MDTKTISKFVVWALVWVNAWLSQNGFKPIPVLDQTNVAVALAFAYSIYEWADHFIKTWKAKKAAKTEPPPVAAEKPQEPVLNQDGPNTQTTSETPTATPAAAPQTAAAPNVAVTDPEPPAVG